jgi:hypothetical protein
MKKRLIFTLYVLISFTTLIFIIKSSMSESQPTISLRNGDSGVLAISTDISTEIDIRKDINVSPELTSVTLSVLRLPALSAFPNYIKFCVDQITLEVQGDYETIFFGKLNGDITKWQDTKVYKFQDTCLTDKKNHLRGAELNAHFIGLPTDNWDGGSYHVNFVDPSNYYPFDTFKLDIIVTLDGIGIDKSGNSNKISRLPYIDGLATVSGWRKQSEFTQRRPPYEIQNKQIVHFYRPTTHLGFILVLFLSVYILIASLLIIKESISVLEISIGILLGLWGIQDIIIPKDLSPTFIQSIILSLYVFLLVTLAIRFLFLNRLRNNLQAEIPNRENRANPNETDSIPTIQPNDNRIESLGSNRISTDIQFTHNEKPLIPNANILALTLSLLAFLTSLFYFWKRTKRN